jgi:hypothetical protein
MGDNFPANSRSAVTTGAPPLKVFGRDKERDKVIAMLHKKECDGQQKSKSDIPYSVIGIHGIAGSGKSTLAQVVYAREKKRQARPCSLPHPNPKYFLFHPSHQIFRRMYGTLNVSKKDN